MMSPSTIRKRNQEAKKKASRQNKEPYVIYNKEAIDDFDQFPFPDLGDYRPEGWELVDRYFVDATGFGDAREPAKSMKQFKRTLKSDMDEDETYGYAVIEAGEFQVYVGKFLKLSE